MELDKQVFTSNKADQKESKMYFKLTSFCFHTGSPEIKEGAGRRKFFSLPKNILKNNISATCIFAR
ncbi:hypothetical protein ASJ81_09945 [Methanosarcina spelaei]|uniref:Uncharacterized protein n=1 Tax=Methanosarcina spelaei TaxID=1036679 RepID=A0A2A2HQM6_9EURY|nr:hypothetical protein ASJ81_09945 [Methanosarcina spelaei]